MAEEFKESDRQTRIRNTLEALKAENEIRNISCIATVVVYADGSSARMMHGYADELTLLGSFAYLSGVVLKNELESSDADEHCPQQRTVS